MKITSTYPVKIKNYNKIFNPTVQKYRNLVGFYITLCLNEWADISAIKGTKLRQTFIESISVPTSNVLKPKYNINNEFYKVPCYLRRSAIHEAIGAVSSYKSNLANWMESDPKTRGNESSAPKPGFVYPALYRGNMYNGDIFANDNVEIKIYAENTWKWLKISLKKSDLTYIRRYCKNMKHCVPTLQKRGREWFLDFAFIEDTDLVNMDIWSQRIVAVDLGINNACTCSVMRADGTVLGRHFLSLPREYDCLKRKTDHIKRAQRHGSRKTPNLWAYAKGVNDDIAVKTANYIIGIADLYDANVIVFENLNFNGKKRGSKKQRLHLWRARYVQEMVAHKAHHDGRHISRINPWGTSRLAFDGSGRVKRGKESDKTNNNYSLCEFSNGKIYNCDLGASYNIGARYFVREILKSLPATERQRIEAKVPGCAKRSTCTLSTLISLYGELFASADCPAA